MKKKRVVVTGGTGFIGMNLIKRLVKSNFSVTGIFNHRAPPSIPNVEWRQWDLTCPPPPDLFADADGVLMCAAISSGAKDIINRPEIFVTQNTLINQNTILAATQAGTEHIVFPSCSVMYPSSEKIQGEDDVRIDRIYEKYVGGAAMKLYVEQLCRFYSMITTTRFTVIRHTNTYGPHDKFDRDRAHVFAASILKTENNPESIEVWGTGEEGRDFVYVEDLVDLMVRTLSVQKEKFELVCAGSENLISINELIKTICSVRRINPLITHNLSSPSLPVNIVLSHQRALNLFGWKPTTSLEDGIRKTIAWRESVC
jgi:GDP-L-fucose synthase